MPELCRFYGIVIKMFYDDHNPLHQRELLEAWERARRLEPPGKIDPLP